MNVDVPRLLDALGIEYREHHDELWAPCPHPQHTETRPSWSIATDPHGERHGLHYCFGCGFEGSALDLVMACLGDVSYSHARQWVTDRGLWLKGAVPLAVEVELRVGAGSKLIVPRGLKGGPLDTWVTPVRRYAISRGLTPQQVMRWRIMYATEGSMAGRIVFPLRDSDGGWRSFHARTYAGQDKRYKNAAAEDGYDPGAVFGMEHWPPAAARRLFTVTLTEGTLDALACERAGAGYICAIGGSQLHPRQALKLSGWGRVVCATDGDKAGDTLAEEVRCQLARVVPVKRAEMPREKKLKDAAALALANLPRLTEVLNAADT